jgi:tetratricopeptide (TPR) repeat protein
LVFKPEASVKKLLVETADRAARYVTNIANRRVVPAPSDVARLEALGGPLPESPSDPSDVLALLDDIGSPATVATAGGRYFGFVIGGSLPVALAANWLAGAWDQNAAMQVMSPVAAKAAFQQYAHRASPLSRLYAPGFKAQLKQTGGDLEGALASYRQAVLQLGKAKQSESAGRFLRQFAVLSVLLREGSSALSFAQQQKLDNEEQQTVAFLQTMAGNASAARQSSQRFASSQPWVSSRSLEIEQVFSDVAAAVQRGDGQTALSRAASVPDFQFLYFPFLKGRAHLLTNDNASAETDFRGVLRRERNLENSGVLTERFPVLGILSHYYLGQLYERTSKRDQAINEYQEFLSHFASSRSRLPQVGEARTALKRLMQ